MSEWRVEHVCRNHNEWLIYNKSEGRILGWGQSKERAEEIVTALNERAEIARLRAALAALTDPPAPVVVGKDGDG